ncbi:hypothetical protein EHV15_34850 [Paenibacillus oralis]|uniref:Uncharacterized protein n=1 Tax=Paenibacillus oralis TaxID=2490856 RepID=A0A3P3T9Z8_9BACL|nr:hypothetical protein [Paenibacillus oralis]RRJ54772.1 hypothetical protein EHV15_34850 [Paenibacillus oralis]
MNSIKINSQNAFYSDSVKGALKADLFSTNLLLVGDINSGRMLAIKNVIDQVVVDGRTVLSIDFSGEFIPYVKSVGGKNVPAPNFTNDLQCENRITNVTFLPPDKNDWAEKFLSKLVNVSPAQYQYIVIDRVDLLFSSVQPDDLSKWFNTLNESNITVIGTSNEVAKISEFYSSLVDKHFKNVLIFRSKYYTDSEHLLPGEALLKTDGEWQDHTLRFAPTSDEWVRYNNQHIRYIHN